MPAHAKPLTKQQRAARNKRVQRWAERTLPVPRSLRVAVHWYLTQAAAMIEIARQNAKKRREWITCLRQVRRIVGRTEKKADFVGYAIRRPVLSVLPGIDRLLEELERKSAHSSIHTVRLVGDLSKESHPRHFELVCAWWGFRGAEQALLEGEIGQVKARRLAFEGLKVTGLRTDIDPDWKLPGARLRELRREEAPWLFETGKGGRHSLPKASFLLKYRTWVQLFRSIWDSVERGRWDADLARRILSETVIPNLECTVGRRMPKAEREALMRAFRNGASSPHSLALRCAAFGEKASMSTLRRWANGSELP